MVSRRLFLAGSASALALAACGGSSTTGNRGAGTTAPVNEGDPQLGTGFASGLRGSPPVLAAGIPQRAPLIIFDEIGRVWRDDLPPSLEVEVLHAGSTVASAVLARHGEGIPTPYYPLELTPPEPGDYEVRSPYSPTAAQFRVATVDEVGLIQAGDPLRPVATPTFDDARGVDPICTRYDPCPFHELRLDEVAGAGRPTVLVIATPGFCQTDICGPVLELVIDRLDGRDDVAVVHAEVYRNPNEISAGLPDVTESITTYGLSFEPSMVLADGDGVVTARLDFTWDVAELDAALRTIGV